MLRPIMASKAYSSVCAHGDVLRRNVLPMVAIKRHLPQTTIHVYVCCSRDLGSLGLEEETYFL